MPDNTDHINKTTKAGADSDIADYEDILYHEYRGVKHHTPMPEIERAAQFAPFAALPTGEEKQ